MLKNLHFWRVWLPPHLLAIAGLLLVGISWQAVAIAFAFYTLISGLGVAVGFHRFFSHKAFKTSPFWEQAMLYFGCLSCQGGPFFWVALHRGLHHRYSDTEKDPHSPVAHSLWTAYQGYTFDNNLGKAVPLRAAADFLRQPSWHWAMNHYHKVLYGTWAVALLIGVFYPPFLLGLALAQVWAIHQEAIVNVLGHVGGLGAYRNYDTSDQSVNRPLLGLITWGQALHNNHHGDAANPDFGSVRPYEFDPSMLWIKAIRT